MLDPPQDIEAEASIIGAMLSSAEAAAKAVERLKAIDFANDAHRSIYTAAFNVFNEGKPVDCVTVASELERRGALDESGGAALLRSMVDAVPSADNAAEYADAVKNASTARKVLQTSYDVQEMVRSGKTDPEGLLASLEGSLLRISEEANRSDFQSIKNVMRERYARLGEETLVEGVETGFCNIDKVIGGLVPGRLYVLAARPGIGKTTLAVNIAQKISLQECGSVLLYSLEMSSDELSDRIVSSMAGVVSQSIQTGTLDGDEYGRVFRAIGHMEKSDMFIDDDATLTLHSLRAKARRFAASHKIALIVVDYLQLLTLDGGKTENRQQEISTITRQLKKLGQELHVPTVILSQLNREPEMRRDKKPQLSDLRDSGAIEQDADVVMFIHFDPDDESRTMADVLIEKNRHGPRGIAQLIFTPEFTRFRDFTRIVS